MSTIKVDITTTDVPVGGEAIIRAFTYEVLLPTVKQLGSQHGESLWYHIASETETFEEGWITGLSDGVRDMIRTLCPEYVDTLYTQYRIAGFKKMRELDAEGSREWEHIGSIVFKTPQVYSPCTGFINGDSYGGTVVSVTGTDKRPIVHCLMDSGALVEVSYNKKAKPKARDTYWNDGGLLFFFGRAVNKLDPHF